MKHVLLFALCWLLGKPSSTLSAQPTTSLPVTSIRLLRDSIGNDSLGQSVGTLRPTPRKATIRSLLLPGLGQIYNRQAWKLTFIYGGAGAAIYIFQHSQTAYIKYRAGYEKAYMSNASPKIATVDGVVLGIQQLKRASDLYRQQRDLTLILTVVGWALNAVEANVTAHLMSFDLSDDLSLRITPALLSTGTSGFASGIRLTMNTR